MTDQEFEAEMAKKQRELYENFNKSQWRLDVEEKINKATSPAQKLRFALYHVYMLIESNNPNYLESKNTEQFYVHCIETVIDEVLSNYEKMVNMDWKE